MNHLGTQPLETADLLLRPFTLADGEPMYRNWASDEEVVAYLTWPAHTSVAVSQQVLDQWVKNYQKQDYYQWAITLRADELNPIGSIGANFCDDGLQMARIGYCIGKAWWGQGYVTASLERVIDYLFDEVGMKRIEAQHDGNNLSSGAVMKKCGMQYEGTLRQGGRNNQGICDLVCYGILATDRKMASPFGSEVE